MEGTGGREGVWALRMAISPPPSSSSSQYFDSVGWAGIGIYRDRDVYMLREDKVKNQASLE